MNIIVQAIRMTAGWCGWKPSNSNSNWLGNQKVTAIRCKLFFIYFHPLQLCSSQERSVAPSIFNIKAQWVVLGNTVHLHFLSSSTRLHDFYPCDSYSQYLVEHSFYFSLIGIPLSLCSLNANLDWTEGLIIIISASFCCFIFAVILYNITTMRVGFLLSRLSLQFSNFSLL